MDKKYLCLTISASLYSATHASSENNGNVSALAGQTVAIHVWEQRPVPARNLKVKFMKPFQAMSTSFSSNELAYIFIWVFTGLAASFILLCRNKCNILTLFIYRNYSLL